MMMIKMDDIISKFLDRSYEDKINENLLEYEYIFPKKEILKYIFLINNIPIKILLDEICLLKKHNITSRDLVQFSNKDNATNRLCEVLSDINNPGCTMIEIGKLLLKNFPTKKVAAYRKYGENHAKTGEALGLVYNVENVYFLSCIGMVYNTLPQEKQKALLTRLILRTYEIEELYRTYSKYHQVDARQFMSILSDSTYRRRKSNLYTFCKLLESSSEYDFSSFVQAIQF